MKNVKISKVITVYILTLMMIIMQFNFNYKITSGVTPKIVISDYTISKDDIKKGDSFILTLTLQNKSINYLSGVNLEVDPSGTSSFFMKNTGSVISVGALEISQEKIIQINLTYDGGKNRRLPMSITYNDGASENTIQTSVGINISDEAEVGDTTKYRPRLSITNTSTSSIQAGQSSSIPVTIKNITNYKASDISITPSLDKDTEDALIINDESVTKDIKLLNANGSNTIYLKLRSLENAASKTYPIKINYELNNTYGDTFSGTGTVYVSIVNNSVVSNVSITSVNTQPETVQAGEKANVDVAIKNTGTRSARNVKVTLSGLKEGAFITTGSTNVKSIGTLEGGKETKVTFTLIASKKIDTDDYPLTAKVTYIDSSDKADSDEQAFFIGAQKKEVTEDDDGSIDIDNVTIPNEAIKPDTEFIVGFSVINTGNVIAKNIKVSLTPDTTLITKTPTVKIIKSLKPNEKQNLKFLFSSTKDAATKSYPIQINADYETLVNNQKIKQTANQYISVYIEKPQVNKNSKKTVPKIILDRYDIEPSIVEAGNNFKVNLSFLNTNRYKAVQNIKIYLTAPEGTTTTSTTDPGNIFTPVNGSNTFYIDSIAPKNRVEKQIELYAINDAKPKTYTITANFEYEDASGTQYKSTEYIGIPVRQQAKIETSDISIPPDTPMGQPITVAFDFYNTGKTMLRNLMIKSVGSFDVQSQNSFIGNFDVGSSDHYEATLMPKKEGKLDGFVVISYEDANGQKQEIKKEITANISKAAPIPSMDPNALKNQENQSAKKSIFKNPILWSAVAVIVVGGIIFIIIKRKKRKKALEEMDLDE